MGSRRSTGADEVSIDHEEQGQQENYNAKLLVRSECVGALIGKNGSNIASMQRETEARAQISKHNHNYNVASNTSDRVCSLSGRNLSGLTKLAMRIADIENEDDDYEGTTDDLEFAERRQLRLLVPNATAGVIIGRGGGVVRQLVDETGANIQLSQKGKGSERVVTVVGDRAAVDVAFNRIIERIHKDPHYNGYHDNTLRQKGSDLSLIYLALGSEAVESSGGSTSHTSGPVSRDSSSVCFSPHSETNDNNHDVNNISLGLVFSFNGLQTPSEPSRMAQQLKQVHSMLHHSGFSDSASQDILLALRCLASHGVLVINQAPINNGYHQPMTSTISSVATDVALAPERNNAIPLTNDLGLSHLASEANNVSLVARVSNTDASSLWPSYSANPKVSSFCMNRLQGREGDVVAAHSSSLLSSFDYLSGKSGGIGDFGNRNSVALTTINNNSYGLGPHIVKQEGCLYNDFEHGRGDFTNDGHLKSQGNSVSCPNAMNELNGVNITTPSNSMNQTNSLSRPTTFAPSSRKSDYSCELLVAEDSIGALFGPSGQAISALQSETGASIQVSKKGSFAPGTRNRIVVIKADSEEVLEKTRVKVQLKLDENRGKRGRQAHVNVNNRQ